VEHSEDPTIDDPILEHAGGTLGTASLSPADGAHAAGDDSEEKGKGVILAFVRLKWTRKIGASCLTKTKW